MSSLKQVSLPVSKSLYIRKLICDFLKRRPLDEMDESFPADVRIVRDCLVQIAEVESGQNLTDKPVCIDVYDCGAAYRFLMALLAITPGQWLLTGTEHLLQRPIEELVEALRSIGAEIQWCPCRDVPCRVSDNDGVYPHGDAARSVSTNTEYIGFWQIHGKSLHASEMTIDCTRSGQFATALLLISDIIGLKNLNILPQNPSSFAYIAMTKEIMNGKADLEANHMGDWSAAVYWYARLLLEGQMQSSHRSHFSSGAAPCVVPESYKLLHLDLHSIQSDAVLAHWFSDWGIESRQEEDGVVISYNERLIKPQEVIELDMSQNVDLVPVMACMACIWPKTMIFNGVANLKYKESDRLNVIQEQLSPFAKIEIKSYNGIPNNQLVIGPIDTHSSYSNLSCDFSFNAHNDHRFVMGFSLFALKGKVQIKGFDCVRKSYPNFNAEGVIAGPDIVG